MDNLLARGEDPPMVEVFGDDNHPGTAWIALVSKYDEPWCPAAALRAQGMAPYRIETTDENLGTLEGYHCRLLPAGWIPDGELPCDCRKSHEDAAEKIPHAKELL
jgi:hypothetical protein